MRRTDDVRETVDEILAEQKRSRVRRVIFGGEPRGRSRVPRTKRQIIVDRVGPVLVATGTGGVIGAVLGDASTGAVAGMVLGVLLGSQVMN